MSRKDWYYVNFRTDMGESLDYIIKKEGKKYGWEDRVQLTRWLVGEFIARYEEHNNIVIARNAVRLDSKRDAMKPITKQP